MQRKYEFTGETVNISGRVLHRIRALINIPKFKVKKGDLGGLIEKESNLSHIGSCWVSKNAQVWDDAKVIDEAKLYNFAKVFGRAIVCQNAKIKGSSVIFDSAQVWDDAVVSGRSAVHEQAIVKNRALIKDNVTIKGNSEVGGTVIVENDCTIEGQTCLCGDAVISSESDFITIKNCWSSNRVFTYTKSNKRWSVGCFYGTGQELIAKAYKDDKLKGKCYEMTVNYVEAIYNTIRKETSKIKKLNE